MGDTPVAEDCQRIASACSEDRHTTGFFAMNYHVFLNPQLQQLSTFVRSVSQALHVDPETIPCARAFEENEGSYLDEFSRIALGWNRDREKHQLIVRLRWL